MSKSIGICVSFFLVCASLWCSVSSFIVYREGFADTPFVIQQILSAFSVIVLEGTLLWLIYGLLRAFSSLADRLIAFAGIVFFISVMTLNVVVHFRLTQGLPLTQFHQDWLLWGAVGTFVGGLFFVVLITLTELIVSKGRRYAA